MKVDNIEICEFLYLPTTRCNCRCKHCAPQVYTGKEIEMTSQQLIEKYEKSKFLKGNSVSVAGGEPFLKDDIDEFIVYLDSHKIPTVISTNGWFTDRIERLINKLENCETVRFAISIDGPESMHDEIRRCKGIYQKAVQSALMLHERGFQVQINMVVQKDNLEYLEEFDTFFKNKGIPVIYIPVVFVGEEEFNFTPEDIRKIFRFVDYPRGRKYLLSKGKWLIKNCHAGRNSWMLDCNGDVYACWGGYYKENAKEYLMGNLYEKDFDDIFMSDEKEAVYAEVVSGCEGCLLPRDIERETEVFGYSTKLTYDEVAVLADDLCNISYLEDYSVEPSEWYDREKINNNNFHWMKKLTATLYVNIKEERATQLILHYLNWYTPKEGEAGMSVSLSVQNSKLIAVECEFGENTLCISIPEELNLHGLVKIDLKINKQWIPAEINTESFDTRSLGLGIFSVELL